MAPVTCKEIERYIWTSYGYGNVNADCWIIGMEQHCDGDGKNIERRISKWGSKPFQDLKTYHQSIGGIQYCKDGEPTLPRTWSKLICFLKGLQGEPYPEERIDIKTFQKQQLGTRHGKNCLLELLPLPSPSTKPANWPRIYMRKWAKQYPRLSFLKERETYERMVRPKRIRKIQNLLNRLSKSPAGGPRVVLFYGKGFEEDWNKIVGKKFPERWGPERRGNVTYLQKGRTWFVSTNHVAGRGSLKKRECHELGDFLRRKVASDAKNKTEK